jgi:hypothetical protein
MYHGDQGQFIRRSDLSEIGGYPSIPLMEDVQLSQKMREFARKKSRRIHFSRTPIYANPRRISANGFWRMVFLYFYLKTLYYLGYDLKYIARVYNNLRKA